ncbi:MAG: hypothetical protein M3O91_02740 [Chloroflexota bacterium]|nr:hypothetical protein [Chloroflexota bacterium]
MNGTVYFHEQQRFRQSWLWVVIVVPVLVAFVIAVVSPSRETTIIGVAVPLVTAALLAMLFAFVNLETTVTPSDITVSFHGLWPTRRIRYDEIEGYESRSYGILDSGGWGVHFGLAGMTYNVSGNRGVAFALRGGRLVLIGTQRPDEFVAAVGRAMEERRPL